MKQDRKNAFSQWSFHSYLSQKEAEDAILAAASGESTMTGNYLIYPVTSVTDLRQVIAAKQFSKATEKSSRANPDVSPEQVSDIIKIFSRDFSLDGLYNEKGPQIAHDAIERLMRKKKLRIGIVWEEWDKRHKWSIVPAGKPFEFPERPVLPENYTWDGRIIEMVYKHRPHHRGDIIGPRDLATMLKNGLGLECDIPNCELVTLVHRLMRRDMMYLETRRVCSWRGEFSVHLTKHTEKRLNKAFKNTYKQNAP